MVISTQDKNRVLEEIKKGTIDAADVSFPNLIDEIILKMKNLGVLDLLKNSFTDKRASNSNIPLHLLLTLAITAKMKLKTSLTDIPFAITSADTLSEIGWNIWDNERGLEEGLMDEGAIRNYAKKYESDDFINSYNDFMQNQVPDRFIRGIQDVKKIDLNKGSLMTKPKMTWAMTKIKFQMLQTIVFHQLICCFSNTIHSLFF